MLVIKRKVALAIVSALLAPLLVGSTGPSLILTMAATVISFCFGVWWGKQERRHVPNEIPWVETDPIDIGSDELEDEKEHTWKLYEDNVKRKHKHISCVTFGTQTDDPTSIQGGIKRCCVCGYELDRPKKKLNRRKYKKSVSNSAVKTYANQSYTHDSVYGKTNRSVSVNGCTNHNVQQSMSFQQEQQEHVQSHNSRHQIHWFVNSGHRRETGVYKTHSDDTVEEMETEDFNTSRKKQPSPSASAIEITNMTEVEFYSDNLKFYRNQICTRPFPGLEIEGILEWKGDYTRLEEEHSYIQWLFPTPQTSGHNFSAQQLYPHEAEAIQNDDVMHARVLRAYKMMLDFFGMELVDERSGMIRRCAANWKERYAHLNTSFHNCMRITRILISIGQLGYARFQVPLVKFLMTEAIVTKELHNLNSDSMDYWIEAVVDGDEMFDLMQLRQFMQQNRKNLETLLGTIFQTA